MFVDADPDDFYLGERVVGELGNGARRGNFGNAQQFVEWVSQNGIDQPAYTTIGRWRYGEQAAYTRPTYIPWFTLDLDGSNPASVHGDVNTVLSVLDVEGYDIRRVMVSYSGKKGFHIQIPAGQYGDIIFEHADAATAFMEVLYNDLCDGVDFDKAVCSPQALIKVAGSQHPETGNFKRTWYGDNFQNLPLKCIFSNINSPRKRKFADPGGKPVQGARDHLSRLLSDVREKLSSMQTFDDSEHKNGGVIATIKPGLLEGQEFGNKPFHVGRENAAYILGCWYLERYSEARSWALLRHWNKRNEPRLPETRLRTQFRGAKRTIYDQRR